MSTVLLSSNAVAEMTYKPSEKLPFQRDWTIQKNIIELSNPNLYRVELKNPYGQTIYMVRGSSNIVEEKTDSWNVKIPYHEIKIPNFPKEGKWKLEYKFYKNMFSADFQAYSETKNIKVQSGSFLDSFVAPFYLYFDPVPVTSSDDISIAFPSLFWISIGVLAIILIVALINEFREKNQKTEKTKRKK